MVSVVIRYKQTKTHSSIAVTQSQTFSLFVGHEQSGAEGVEQKSAFFPDKSAEPNKEVEAVTQQERNNWIVNIENSAAAIESQLGSAVVESVFKRYGAHGTWDLSPSEMPDVFSELYAMEADLR